MTLLLGIDTGGTYTDAVLYDGAAATVVRTAKALTTRHDLAVGIAEAVDAVLPDPPPALGFVSLSTTLATNAVVEGQGQPVALLLIGQGTEVLGRAGLGEALGTDPVLALAGGHDAYGEEAAALDLAPLRAALPELAGRVAGFAVAAQFAVRNPAHERRVRDLLRAETGLPVTCSHELSRSLDAPRRALTALLNARLVPLLQRLVLAVREHLRRRGVAAPLMVVKGDGSLVTAETALLKPVETILSGPAASVVGARALSGAGDALVADIGGTTTDIALLTAGRPALDPDGARVGGWRTMVEAVAVRAVGLGGDSQLHLDRDDRGRLALRLGPRRAVPLALLARIWPQAETVLRVQALRSEPKPTDGLFALLLAAGDQPPAGLSRGEAAVWRRLAESPVAMEAIAGNYLERQGLERLIVRGLAAVSGFTPSDAAHVSGAQSHWPREASVTGAEVWGRRAAALAVDAPADGAAFAALVADQLERQTAAALIDAALSAGGERAAAADGLLDRALRPRPGLLSVDVTLGRPLVGVGGPAATFYPAVATRLHTRLLLPDHAAVCNAVGAVAGGILQRVKVPVLPIGEERVRVHLPEALRDFGDRAEAFRQAEAAARAAAEAQARAAGAAEVEIEVAREETVVDGVGGRSLFVEGAVIATAVGRPRVAAG